MYKSDRELFTQTARFWTDTYAQEQGPMDEVLVRRIKSIRSFFLLRTESRNSSTSPVLESNCWELHLALFLLYSRPHLHVHSPQVVGRLVDMGFDAESASKALNDCNGDESAAVNMLLGI